MNPNTPEGLNPLTAIKAILAQHDESMLPIAEEYIAKYKLKLRINNFQLVELGDTTTAWLSRFITQDEKMLSMKSDVLKLANAPEDRDQLFTVLITGPSGTGKEMIARALHGERPGKFTAINCAGMPRELIESECFGHKKGSFTGAWEDKLGLMEVARDGTLFMDEIGELGLDVQAKFLRAIQEKKIRRVGDTRAIDINCRIVCATHRDIAKMAKKDNTFRLDLYGRISTYELDITPLYERPNDIPLILASMDGGDKLIEALTKDGRDPMNLDVSLGVRSLQQHVKRFKVFGRLPL